MIIGFLYNEGADTHDITQRLQAQFSQNVYALRTVQFWIGEVRRDCHDLHDENRMGDLLLMILIQKFWLSWTNLLSNRLGR
jgi:hypothetical protein